MLILVEKEYKNHAWDRAKKMMSNVDQFKNRQAQPLRRCGILCGSFDLCLPNVGVIL